MAYQALYRKYRPKTFDEVVGQEHITRTLSNQVKEGKISHAYLFCGSRGTGKTSTAKIFAKAINCTQSRDGSPCYSCEVCKALDSPGNIDIVEIDAASNNRVDEVREIRENVKFMPVSGKYKVYIIDEVHMLTDSAFNALLKTLEEPPAHVVFILATTEVHKLPATILSRCLRFDFGLVPVDVLTAHLKKIFDNENLKYEEEALKAIAVAGEGSVRDMLSIADCIVAYSGGEITLEKVLDILGLNRSQTLVELTDYMFKKDIGESLELINKVSESGKNMAVFAKDMSVHFRDLLVIKTCKNSEKMLMLPKDIYESYVRQASEVETNWLIENMKIFGSIEAELRYSLSPKTLLETAVITSIGGEDLKKN